MNELKYLKNNLKVVEVEVFSYCNRVCWFCPNSFIDRRSSNTLMPEETYINILDQLKEIDYSGDVTYSRYNEPTAKKDIILTRLRQAREKLPKANLKTNSNGDYINKEYLVELRDAGLNEIFLQHYEIKPNSYNYENNKILMEKKLKKLGLPYELITDIPGNKIEYRVIFDGMRVQLRSRNFVEDGSSRGGTIDLANDYTRTQRCLQPFNNMYIDYNGKVMVCCALRSDIEEHKDGVTGDIHKDSLATIFSSNLYSSWRNHHLTDGPKEGVCKTCRDNVKPHYEK
jgi:MoaA/NifB/PqqE/SkfB family radical SAM enzyme